MMDNDTIENASQVEDLEAGCSGDVTEKSNRTTREAILSGTDVCAKLNYIIRKLDKLEKSMSRLERQSPELTGEVQCNENEGESRESSSVGEETDDDFEEMGETFPVKTVNEMMELEQRLQNPDFALRVETYLREYSEQLENVFHFIATDNVYIDFNYDGRAGKNELRTLILYNKILPDVCGEDANPVIFGKEVRRCVMDAHNRFHKTKKATKNTALENT